MVKNVPLSLPHLCWSNLCAQAMWYFDESSHPHTCKQTPGYYKLKEKAVVWKTIMIAIITSHTGSKGVPLQSPKHPFIPNYHKTAAHQQIHTREIHRKICQLQMCLCECGLTRYYKTSVWDFYLHMYKSSTLANPLSGTRLNWTKTH